MNYKVEMIRRTSKNNGLKFCKYAVICDETGEIVRDDNKRYDRKDHLEKVKAECDEINSIGNFDTWMKQREEKFHLMYLANK